MRLSEEITLAIFGGTCTGKTTFVQYLTNKYLYPARHCGDVVRHAACIERVELSKLSDESHSRIDNETVGWVKKTRGPKLAEGRYLDWVLAGGTDGVILVRFLANIETRVQRLNSFKTYEEAEAEILHADARDNEICKRLYGDVVPLGADLIVHTSNLSMEEIEKELWKQVG